MYKKLDKKRKEKKKPNPTKENKKIRVYKLKHMYKKLDKNRKEKKKPNPTKLIQKEVRKKSIRKFTRRE
jgi:hypothetical protein